MKELLIGCGSRTNKDLFTGENNRFQNVVRLDINSDHKPDVLHDLRSHPLPFPDNEFDEIHAYEILEHLASQGDHEFFFREFSEYWRILKPDGTFLATVPSLGSRWLWGDPSHRRAVSLETLSFLSQKMYARDIGKTPMSDYRNIYAADFDLIYHREEVDRTFFVLEAKK